MATNIRPLTTTAVLTALSSRSCAALGVSGGSGAGGCSAVAPSPSLLLLGDAQNCHQGGCVATPRRWCCCCWPPLGLSGPQAGEKARRGRGGGRCGPRYVPRCGAGDGRSECRRAGRPPCHCHCCSACCCAGPPGLIAAAAVLGACRRGLRRPLLVSGGACPAAAAHRACTVRVLVLRCMTDECPPVPLGAGGAAAPSPCQPRAKGNARRSPRCRTLPAARRSITASSLPPRGWALARTRAKVASAGCCSLRGCSKHQHSRWSRDRWQQACRCSEVQM